MIHKTAIWALLVIQSYSTAAELKKCLDPATEYDAIQNLCKLKDGRGEAIRLDDVNKALICANGFVGKRALLDNNILYYLCTENGVYLGRCCENEIFNRLNQKCEHHLIPTVKQCCDPAK